MTDSVERMLTIDRFYCLLDRLDAPVAVHPNLQLHHLSQQNKKKFRPVVEKHMRDQLVDVQYYR